LSIKLRIRIGEVEIDYEGTEEFLKQELPQLLKDGHGAVQGSGRFVGRRRRRENARQRRAAARVLAMFLRGRRAASPPSSERITGGDLLLAAAAHLVLVKKTEAFSQGAVAE
jgi:hypothetical protein